MTKIFYQPKTFLVKPIDEPEKINIFKHTILFINEEDASIERAIPDFEERHIDSKSSNIEKIDEFTAFSFFELVDKNDAITDEPVFSVTIYEGTDKNPTEFNGPKVINSTCINGFSTTIEDIIYRNVEKNKGKKIG